MKQFLLIFSFFFLTTGAKLFAQFNICPAGQPISALFCDQACIVCDMNSGIESSTSPLPLVQQITIDGCGGDPITIENPNWFSFIAGSPGVVFTITSPTCTGFDLEAAVVPTCSLPLKAIACVVVDPATPYLPVIGLIPGQQYYIVIDGVDAAFCDYRLDVFFGSAEPPPLGAIGAIEGLTEVCPKADITYSIQPVPGAFSYTWTAPAGSKINGGGNTAILPASTGTAVTIDFGNVSGQVCVTASNPCETTTVTSCISVTNTPIPITLLDDITICYEELPYIWPESPNTAVLSPGTYTLTSSAYPSYLGCDSLVRQKVRALPFKFKQLPPTYLCEPNCFYVNGFEFCEPGSYSEILTAADGCDSLLNFSIFTIPVNAVVQPAPDTLTCAVTSTILTSEGSTTGNSVFYSWLNPSGQIVSDADTAVATTPGTYTFIVTNYGGGGQACKDTATVTVVAQTIPPQADAGPDFVLSCSQPQVQLQGSGSTGSQYSYLWVATNGGNIVSGSATLTPIVNATGFYTLRVTDNLNGCTAVSVAVVTAQTLPPTASASGGTVTCLQPNVNLQLTTNAASPTFLWNGPNGFTSALQNPSATASGTYTVTVTDGVTGCTNSATATVIAGDEPPGATAVGDTLTCVVNSVVISGNTNASNPAFAWTGPNGFASSLQNPTVTESGNYVLTVTGTNGCTSTATATVILNTNAPGASLATSGNLNCNNASVNIIATSGAPAGLLTHTWTNPDGSTTSTGAVPVLNANQPGAYSVLITNTLNGCTSTAAATVVQNPAVTATASSELVSCNGGNDGSVNVTPGGGNNTYQYEWNTGATSATVDGLAAGTYTVTVTDGEDCSATATVVVGEPEPIAVNATATPQINNGEADGTASANPSGGTPGYSYLWSNDSTTATITGLLPGSYTVTVTDENGCTAVAVVTVNAVDCNISATVQTENVTCAGAADGSATIVVANGNAPFTYEWSNGGTTATIENLAPGQYIGTATDATNCPTEVIATITQPNPLLPNASTTNASGPGTNDGTATAGPTGGTPPYTYLWTTSETTASIANLGGGMYTVTVTDDNDCTAVQTVEVIEGNCGLQSDFVVENPTCNGLTNGEATVVITGGNGNFTYEWSSGGTAATETGLGEGTFTVSVTDSEGCEIVDSVTLTQPALLEVEVESVTNTSCVNTPAGSATVSAVGGTGTISVTWENGQTGFTAINLTAGDFTATATDENGCTATVTATVDAVDTEAPVIIANPINVPLGPTGTVTLTPQNLNLDISDNCAVSSIVLQPTTFNCLAIGPHVIQVTATDDSGNTSTTTVTATIIDNSPPTTQCPPSIVRCFGDDVVQYDAPVATDNCLGNGGFWALTAGLPSGATFPTGVTTNTYTYTDAGGNPGACSFEVTILTQVTASAAITNDIDNQGVGAINLTVNGGLSPYTFQWTKDGVPFATTEDLTNLGVGEYMVVVTDAFGCSVQSETFEVSNTIDTKEPTWASGLSVQPNPTSGFVAVIFPDGVNEEVQLTVFDVTGRRLQQQTAQSPKQMDVDLSALPGGVYPMLLRVQNQIIARRIVVSR